MILSKEQFASHVRGPHDFPDTHEHGIDYGVNVTDEDKKPSLMNPLINQSEKQLKMVFHEPGWDLIPKQEFGAHGFESPEQAPFGHTYTR